MQGLTDWRFAGWEKREQVSAEWRDGVGRAQELHTVEVRKSVWERSVADGRTKGKKTRAKDDEIQIARHNNVPLWAGFRQTAVHLVCLFCFGHQHDAHHPVLHNLTHIIHHRLWRLDTGEDGTWPLHHRHGVALRAQLLTWITRGPESGERISVWLGYTPDQFHCVFGK